MIVAQVRPRQVGDFDAPSVLRRRQRRQHGPAARRHRAERRVEEVLARVFVEAPLHGRELVDVELDNFFLVARLEHVDEAVHLPRHVTVQQVGVRHEGHRRVRQQRAVRRRSRRRLEHHGQLGECGRITGFGGRDAGEPHLGAADGE